MDTKKIMDEINNFNNLVFLFKEDYPELNKFESKINLNKFFDFEFKKRIDKFYEYRINNIKNNLNKGFESGKDLVLNKNLEDEYFKLLFEILSRLAGIKHSGILICECKLNKIDSKVKEKENRENQDLFNHDKVFEKFKILNNIDFFRESSFIVRTNCNKEKEYSKKIYKHFKFRFSMNPKLIIKVFELNNRIICFIDTERPIFNKFSPKFWPYNHPSAMKSKLARTLVNLSACYSDIFNKYLLDPFCGAGGILIEASRMGIKSIGIDIDKWQTIRARKNIEFFKEKLKTEPIIFNNDSLNIDFLKELKDRYNIKHIVSDLPYGKSTYLNKEINRLYLDFLLNIKEIDIESSVIVVPDFIDFNRIIEKTGLSKNLIFRYSIYMHSKLSRVVNVFKFK